MWVHLGHWPSRLEQLAAEMQAWLPFAGRGVGHLAPVVVGQIGDELLTDFAGFENRHAHHVGLGDQQASTGAKIAGSDRSFKDGYRGTGCVARPRTDDDEDGCKPSGSETGHHVGGGMLRRPPGLFHRSPPTAPTLPADGCRPERAVISVEPPAEKRHHDAHRFGAATRRRPGRAAPGEKMKRGGCRNGSGGKGPTKTAAISAWL